MGHHRSQQFRPPEVHGLSHLSDLNELIEEEYKTYDEAKRQLYTAKLLQEILLGLHSLCRGAESKFFNGHTHITSGEFVTFGIKGVLNASKNLRNALLFNVLSYMSNELLTTGNTAASIDELYLFLSNLTAIEYISVAFVSINAATSDTTSWCRRRNTRPSSSEMPVIDDGYHLRIFHIRSVEH